MVAKVSKIEWTDASWNPWHGCRKVSPGCKNCYMYRGKRRYGQTPNRVIRSKTTFYDPLSWSKPRLVFACSWSDWFIEEADHWREEAWDVIRQTPRHTYQILTKRPERILANLPDDWTEGWSNVWLGVSIETQEYIHRKDTLLLAPSNLHFISVEPLLGPINLGSLKGIDWVITGGESGPQARPMEPGWARSIKDNCQVAGVAYFHKQNGGTSREDGSWGGRLLDGRTWDAMPPFHEVSRPSV